MWKRAAALSLSALIVGYAQKEVPPVLPAAVNLNFVQGVEGQVPPGWTVPPTRAAVGYSAELRRTGCHSGVGCAVILPPAGNTTNRDGVLWQQFSAGAYRGATVRLKGWVKLDRPQSGDRVQMELRVRRPNRKIGFVDSMDDRTVRSGDWRLCEIVGKVAADAELLAIAVTVNGRSRAWLDDVSFEIVDRGTPLTAPDPEEFSIPAMSRQPENLDFSRGQSGEVPPGWFVPPDLAMHGYRAELRREGCRSESGCAVVLVPAHALKKDLFGNLMQQISADAYRGRTLQIRAWLRLDAEEASASAQMWFRVDRKNGVMGFFDNMMDRPVRSAAWRRAEIVGEIAADAITINIGVMALGRGTAWVEGVTIEDAPPGMKQTGTLAATSGLSPNSASQKER